MNENEIGFRVQQIRKALKLNQEEFGEKLDITYVQVSRIESLKFYSKNAK